MAAHSENGFSHFLQLRPQEPRQVWVWAQPSWLPRLPGLSPAGGIAEWGDVHEAGPGEMAWAPTLKGLP